MSNAENARLRYEGGQNVTAMTALTNSGDRTIYNSAAALFSRRSGFEPLIRPDGLVTGGAVVKAVSLTNDLVDSAALTAYIGGTLRTVSADTDLTCVRGATTNTNRINSITVTEAGAIVIVSGTASTAFSETRGAAGGPAYIPVGSVEIAQVRFTSITNAPVLASEVFQVVGLHQERYDSPLFEINYLTGKVTFNDALPAIHTADVTKGVSASYASPIFADVPKAVDFVAPETSHSVSSTQIYGSTIGSSSSSLNQGSFTAYLEDGINDPIVKLKNENLFFQFFPDKYKSDYILSQGKLGISRTFPAGDEIQASCTISANSEGQEVPA
jgi:hypothetical protein